MFEIDTGSTVSMHYSVKLEDGTLVDTSEGRAPLDFTVGESSIIAGMISNIMGLKTGDKKTFTVQPAEAYGESDPEQIRTLPRDMFPAEDDVCAGARFMASDGQGRDIPLVIVTVDSETVTADFNHPLAGKPLTFEIEIIEVKESK